MPVDVVTETVINRPCPEVAGYTTDQSNATEWYDKISSVEWKTLPPMSVGSRFAFVAQFLGRRLEYTYEVTELLPGERLVMRTEQGPFPMETTYTWESLAADQTRMSLRNRGEPKGFGAVAGPLMAFAMRRANRKDLAKLKVVLEARRP